MINFNAPRITIWVKQVFTEKCNTHRNKINNKLEGRSDKYPCKYKVESTISPKWKCYITWNILTNIDNNKLEGRSDKYPCKYKVESTISPKWKCYTTWNILTNIERIINLIRDFVRAKSMVPEINEISK